MSTLATLNVILQGDISGFLRSMKSAEDASRNGIERITTAIGSKMTAIGSELTRGLTLPLVGVGVAASKMSMDFETSMQHIVGLVGKSQAQVDAWSKQIMELGPQLGKSPKELAEALYFISSAGIADADAMNVLTAAAKASAAGLGQTQTVADAVSSALNAYAGTNLDAAKATGILVATVREGKGEADQIAPALGRVIPITAQLGISFDQVGAAMAAMTLVGFDSADAATNLSGIMSGLLKPSAGAAGALKSVGLSADGLRKQIKEKGLLSALNEIRLRIGDNDEALAAIFPNIRGFRGLLSLTGENAAQTEQIFKRLAGTTEADLNNAFAAVSDTGAFKFEQAMAQVKDLLIILGNSILPVVIPVLKDLTATVKRLADGFNGLSPEMKQVIVVVGLAAAALGPLLTIGGNLVLAVGAIAGALSGPLILAIGAVVAAGVWLAQNWSTIWPQIQSTVEGVIATVRGVIEGFVNGVKAFWNTFGQEILDRAREAWNGIVDVVKPVAAAVSTIVRSVFGALRDFIDEHGKEILGFISYAWNGISDIVSGVLAVLKILAEQVLGGIAKFISENQQGIKTIFEGAWEAIRIAVSTAIEVVRGVVNATLALLKGDTQGAWDAIKGIFTNVWGNIKGTVTKAAESVRMLLLIVWAKIKEGAQNVWNGIVTAWNNFWGGISTTIQQIGAIIKAAWDSFWGGLRTSIEGIWNGIVTAWNNFWGGISTTIQQIGAIIVGTWNNFWSGLGNTLTTGVSNMQKGWDDFWSNLPYRIGYAIGEMYASVYLFLTVTLPNVFNTFTTALTTTWNTFWGTTIPTAWNNFVTSITATWDTFWGTTLPTAWNNFVSIITTTWNTFWGTTLPTAWNAFVTSITLAWNTFWGVTIPAAWNNFVTSITTPWNVFWGTTLPKAWNDFKTSVTNAWNTFWGTTLPTAWNDFKTTLTNAWNTFWGTTLPNAFNSFKDFLESIPAKFVQIGKDIISGIVQGIRDFAGSVRNALSDVVQGAIDSIKDKLGIQSPSTVFAAFGEQMMRGMALGIRTTDFMPQLALNAATNGLALNATATIAASSAQSMPEISAGRAPVAAGAGERDYNELVALLRSMPRDMARAVRDGLIQANA